MPLRPSGLSSVCLQMLKREQEGVAGRALWGNLGSLLALPGTLSCAQCQAWSRNAEVGKFCPLHLTGLHLHTQSPVLGSLSCLVFISGAQDSRESIPAQALETVF